MKFKFFFATGIFTCILMLTVMPSSYALKPQAAENHKIPTPFQGLEAALGSEHAPVTIIMYYSLTCPHCHDFQETVLPQLRKDYIDRKLVRFIYRDFPTDSLALKAAKLAWCLGKEHYIQSAKKFLATQDQWANPKNTDKEVDYILYKISRELGITEKDFHNCLKDKDREDTIVRTSFEAQKDYELTGAPAFIVNGKVFEGNLDGEAIHGILLKMGIHE